MRFALGLGSSTPDASRRVRAAMRALRGHPMLVVTGASALHRTRAFGGATILPFVNAALVVETALDADALFGVCLALERAHGRARARRHGPRTLDVDVLCAFDRSARARALALPHSGLASRASALVPLAEACRAARVAWPPFLSRRCMRM